jgi:hypothetical protein
MEEFVKLTSSYMPQFRWNWDEMRNHEKNNALEK